MRLGKFGPLYLGPKPTPINVSQRPREHLSDGGDSTGASGGTLSPWTYTSTGSGQKNYVAGYNTVYALDLYSSAAGASTSRISQTVQTVTGRTYTYSFYYYVIGGNTASTFQCAVDNSLSTTVSISLGSVPKGVWRQMSFSFVATSAATTMSCNLRTSSVSSVYISNLSVLTAC